MFTTSIRISLGLLAALTLCLAPNAAAAVIGVHESGGVGSGFKIKTINTSINTGASAGNGALIGVHFGDTGDFTGPDPAVSSITLDGVDISGNEVATVDLDGTNSEVNTAVYFVPGLADSQSLPLSVSISGQKAEDRWAVTFLSLTNVQQSAPSVFDTASLEGFKKTASVSNSVLADSLYAGFATQGTKLNFAAINGTLDGSPQTLSLFKGAAVSGSGDQQQYFGQGAYFLSGSAGTAELSFQSSGNDVTAIGVALSPIAETEAAPVVPEPASVALVGLGGLALLGRRRSA